MWKNTQSDWEKELPTLYKCQKIISKNPLNPKVELVDCTQEIYNLLQSTRKEAYEEGQNSILQHTDIEKFKNIIRFMKRK